MISTKDEIFVFFWHLMELKIVDFAAMRTVGVECTVGWCIVKRYPERRSCISIPGG